MGDYAPGQQLPHIRELVEAGEDSKSTVHAASREGLVASSSGHGTVVRQQTPLKGLGVARCDKAKWRDGDQVAFIADRVATGRAYRRGDQTQTVSLVEAPPVVAEAYGLPVGANVYSRARLVKEGDQPTHTLTSYYRPEHVEGTRIVDPTPGPAGRGGGFHVLYDGGYEIDHMKEQLFARVPTSDEAKLLRLSARRMSSRAAPHHVHGGWHGGGVRDRRPLGVPLRGGVRLQGGRFGADRRGEAVISEQSWADARVLWTTTRCTMN